MQSSKFSREPSLSESEEGGENEGSEKAKKALSLFDLTAMIHPKASAKASKAHSLSNGSAMVATESANEKQRKVNFVPDVKKFGFFHRQSKSSSGEQSTNKIYSISEEVSRQQAGEQREKVAKLEEKALVVSCGLNIQGLDETSTVVINKQAKNEILDSKLDQAASSSEEKKSKVQDADPPTPKDLPDNEQDFSSDSVVKQETIVKDNYMTTRL